LTRCLIAENLNPHVTKLSEYSFCKNQADCCLEEGQYCRYVKLTAHL